MNVAGRQGIARRVEVNEVLVQQGEDRQLAIYWYQERGRVVASEYTSRALMVLDAMRSGRTDGALVRVMTPAGSTPARTMMRGHGYEILSRRSLRPSTATFPRSWQGDARQCYRN